MKANAVFEGGGVKAIALAGALKRVEQQNITLDKVAGTSSGSLVAAFLAAGYSADEMKQIIMETPFSYFLKRAAWHRFNVIGPAVRLFIKKGLFAGERLEYWVRQKLAQKGVRYFGDLPPGQLQIVASDITQGRLLILPDDIAQYGIDPKRFEIAKAVRMSTSLPYFFDPVIIRKSAQLKKKSDKFRNQFVYIVDGGILSNFPLWLFDRHDPDESGEEADKQQSSMIPTLGFQLVGAHEQVPRRIHGPFSMFQALFSTMMDAHDQRFIEKHNSFRTIKIPTIGVRTTQFDIDRETSLKLYDSGYRAADHFFSTKWSLSMYHQSYEQHVLKV